MVDEFIETGKSQNGDVTVTTVEKNGYETTVERLRVRQKQTYESRSLDNPDETVEGTMTQKLADLPTDTGVEVLEALADYYGYRLEPK